MKGNTLNRCVTVVYIERRDVLNGGGDRGGESRCLEGEEGSAGLSPQIR